VERMINLVEVVKQEEEDEDNSMSKEEDAKMKMKMNITRGQSEEEEEEGEEEEKEATASQKMESVSINKTLDERNLSPACLYSQRHAELTLQVRYHQQHAMNHRCTHHPFEPSHAPYSKPFVRSQLTQCSLTKFVQVVHIENKTVE